MPRVARVSRLAGSSMKVSELPNDDHQRTNRLKQFRAFCHAARLGSITRAAEHLMSSQPAVSLQVRSLEEELGVELFDRRGPRISLTPLGRLEEPEDVAEVVVFLAGDQSRFLTGESVNVTGGVLVD